MSGRHTQFISLFAAQSGSRSYHRPSQLRKLKGNEQVAAICFRAGAEGIEFLLVRTRGGKWTFPKGCTEPGLTHAQAAALEASEEAGVHGRMEEASFAHYTHRKGGRRSEGRNMLVHAHLCEVLRLRRPKEENRHPTWFSVNKAKRRLQEDRTSASVAEMMRVVDLAVSRIQRLSHASRRARALRQVQLERPNLASSSAMFGISRKSRQQHVEPRTLLRIPLLTSGTDIAGGSTRKLQVVELNGSQSPKRSSPPVVRRVRNKAESKRLVFGKA